MAAARHVPPASVPELDLLRGIAIVLMIVNHAGVRLLDAPWRDSGALGVLVFLGSCAPVVFFFTTGFGVGLARRAADPGALGGLLAKAGLLLLADQFMAWRAGMAWGLDFLGFIAVATVFVTLVAMARRPAALAAGLVVALLLLRFGLGHRLGPQADVPDLVAWLTGTRAVRGVSYPLTPWMVYPLLGFLAARHCPAPGDAAARARAGRVVVAVAATALVAAAVLLAAHATFFRWGAVSFAFVVVSLGVLGACIVAAWWATPRWPRATRALSLRGIASLAVVPIHYAGIELVDAAGVAPLGPVVWLLVVVALVVFAIAASAAFVRGVAMWMTVAPPAAASLLPALLVLACVALVWLGAGQPAAVVPAFIAGQLAITALLGVRNQRRDRPQATHVGVGARPQ